MQGLSQSVREVLHGPWKKQESSSQSPKAENQQQKSGLLGVFAELARSDKGRCF
jgi:hypothetical protein